MPPNRKIATFVRSFIDLFIRGDLPPALQASGGGTPIPTTDNRIAAGVFDGIDIDWEYPAAAGSPGDPSTNRPPNVYRPEDTQNYTALLAEFRRQLDEAGKETGTHYLLTIAAPIGPNTITKSNWQRFTRTWTGSMSWPMTSTVPGVRKKAPLNFQAPLYTSRMIRRKLMRSAWIARSRTIWRRIPPEKLVMGIPFYGRGWTGVPNVNNGLYQSADTMVAAPARLRQVLKIIKCWQSSATRHSVIPRRRRCGFTTAKRGGITTIRR